MKTTVLLLIALAVPAAAAAQQITKDDILKLHQAGCGDDLILTYLGSKGATLALSADDVAALKTAGVSERVIGMVLKGPVPAPPREQAPPPPPLPTVNVRPTPVVIYQPAPVYYHHYDPWPYVYHDPFWHPHSSFGFGLHGRHSSFFFGSGGHHW